MCRRVVFPDGEACWSVADLCAYGLWTFDEHSDVLNDCLCSVDIDSTLRSNGYTWDEDPDTGDYHARLLEGWTS